MSALETKHGLITIRSLIVTLTTIALASLSGCALFQPPCGADCEANYICNDLNTKFVNNEREFKIAKRASNLDLVQTSCVWREGLVLPKGKEHWQKLIDPKVTKKDSVDNNIAKQTKQTN